MTADTFTFEMSDGTLVDGVPLPPVAVNEAGDPLTEACPACGAAISEAVKDGLAWLYDSASVDVYGLALHLEHAVTMAPQGTDLNLFRSAFEDWTGTPLEDVVAAARHEQLVCVDRRAIALRREAGVAEAQEGGEA